MKNIITKSIVLLLVVCMVIFTFCACGNNDEGIVAVEETPIPTEEPETDYNYTAEFIELPLNTVSLQDSVFSTDGWYTVQYENDIPEIIKIDLEGNTSKLDSYSVIQGNQTENAEFFSDIKGITSNGTNIVTIEALTKTLVSENNNSTESVINNKCYIRYIDKENGSMISEKEIVLSDGESIYPRIAGFDAEGALYIASSMGVEKIDESSTKLIAEDNNVFSLVRLKSGKIGAAVLADNAFVLKELLENTELSVLDSSIGSISNGNNQYDFYYTSDMNLYGYKVDSRESIELLNWTELGLKSDNISSVGSVDGTKLYVLYNNEAKETAELVVISRYNPGEGKQFSGKTLTLVSLNPSDELQQAVVDFNNSNEKINVKLVTIEGQQSDELNIQAIKNYASLSNDGKMPDIIDMTGLPISQFYAEGYAEDLSNYLGKYKNDLFSPVLDALSYDGKVYGVAEGFTLTTVVGSSALVGEDNEITINEYNTLIANGTDMVPLGQGNVREAALWDYVGLTLNKYIDWSNFTCDYSNDDFVSVLELINSLGKAEQTDTAATLINGGKQILKRASLNTFDDIITAGYEFGDKVSYVGYPMVSGSGNILCVVTPLSISSESENKSEAWEFISTFLTEEYQLTNWCFPSNKSAFETGLNEAQKEMTETDETGTEVKVVRAVTFAEDLTSNDVYAVTSTQANKLLEIVNNINNTFEDNNTIYGIISNVASQYFNGEMNADVAAATIQEMVSAYLGSMK